MPLKFVFNIILLVFQSLIWYVAIHYQHDLYSFQYFLVTLQNCESFVLFGFSLFNLGWSRLRC